MSGFGTVSVFENFTIISTTFNDKERCPQAKSLNVTGAQDMSTSFSPFFLGSMILTVLVLLINIIMIAAFTKSWKKLRHNMYIFAFAVCVWDALLGLVDLTNDIHHIVAASDGTAETYRNETSWFYAIKAAIFMAAEVSTAGHTAFIALAYYRYVTAQLHRQASVVIRNSADPRAGRQKSIMMSKKKSYIFSGIVSTISLVIFAGGLFWNCTKDCYCFFLNGKLSSSLKSAACHNKHGCSFLLPSLNSVYALACAFLFFMAVMVLVVTCIRTIHISGGWAAILPYSWHLRIVRKSYKNDSKTDLSQLSGLHRRKNSVQLSYLRNMTHFIFSVTLVYITCRVPANVLLVIDSLSNEQITSADVGGILGILALAHSFLNPIVFYLTLHRMKQAIHELFMLSCCYRTVEVNRGSQIIIDHGNNISMKSLSAQRVEIQEDTITFG